ncbi:MAG: CAAX prenyl protease-related protein [Planctomycetales bacterium]|nr:CAAX prenyl protease-related protein [Planctomycetales bacterium]
MTDDQDPNKTPADEQNGGEQTSESTQSNGDEKPKKPRIELGPPVFGKFRLFIVVIPFIVYLALNSLGSQINVYREKILKGEIHSHPDNDNRLDTISLEDAIAKQMEEDPDETFLLGMFKLVENPYPYTYSFALAVTLACMLPFCWGYFKLPFRLSIWGFLCGAIGIVVWVGLVWLDHKTFNLASYTPEREAYNPFTEFGDNKTGFYQFLAVRLFGFAVIVPIIEEFFIRGFLMRYVDDPDWDQVPLHVCRFGGLISPTVYGLLTHTAEPLAAIAWFSMVTFLYRKTNNIWDCVVAHAVTNGLLAWYVIQYEQWYLW